MKIDELIPDKQLQEIEIKAEQEKKKEYKLIAREKRNRGHIVWEYNKDTHVLARAQYKRTDILLSSLKIESIQASYSYMYNLNCEYLQALNRENAIKHLKKHGFTIIKEKS